MKNGATDEVVAWMSLDAVDVIQVGDLIVKGAIHQNAADGMLAAIPSPAFKIQNDDLETAATIDADGNLYLRGRCHEEWEYLSVSRVATKRVGIPIWADADDCSIPPLRLARAVRCRGL
ncbi:MAG: hypothetical protein KF858_06485 [Candidatus Sumerlaeia bacterium]|nr:hypothetical protein [Candidatus Sumerlaeia bacterium]